MARVVVALLLLFLACGLGAVAAAGVPAPPVWRAQAQWGDHLHVMGAVRVVTEGAGCQLPQLTRVSGGAWQCYGADEADAFEDAWRGILYDSAESDDCSIAVTIADAHEAWRHLGGFFQQGNENLLAAYQGSDPAFDLLTAYRDCPYRLVMELSGGGGGSKKRHEEPAFEPGTIEGVTLREFTLKELTETVDVEAPPEPTPEPTESTVTAAPTAAPTDEPAPAPARRFFENLRRIGRLAKPLTRPFRFPFLRGGNGPFSKRSAHQNQELIDLLATFEKSAGNDVEFLATEWSFTGAGCVQPEAFNASECHQFANVTQLRVATAIAANENSECTLRVTNRFYGTLIITLARIAQADDETLSFLSSLGVTPGDFVTFVLEYNKCRNRITFDSPWNPNDIPGGNVLGGGDAVPTDTYIMFRGTPTPQPTPAPTPQPTPTPTTEPPTPSLPFRK